MWRSRASQSPTRHSIRGFTLIEILIAFAILVVSLAVLLQSFSSGIDAVTRTEQATSAILLARSTLDRVGSEIPLVPGEHVGKFENGLSWAVTLEPATADVAPPVNGLLVRLLQVDVTVTGEATIPITLKTLRLAPAGVAGAAP
jgi:general secretion pathway protein I